MKRLFFIVILALMLGGCDLQEIGTNQTDIETREVVIRNFEFNPQNIVIERGTRVIWVNNDVEGHTVTYKGLFDSGSILRNESFSYVFNEGGEFDYFCKIHPLMQGRVIVTQ